MNTLAFDPTKRRTHLIWWAKPHMMCIWHLAPIVIMCAYFGDTLSADRGVPTYLDTPRILALLGAIATIAIGSVAAFRVRAPRRHTPIVQNWLLNLLFWVSTVAFIVWFHALLSNPALFISLLLHTDGSVYQIREDYSTIPGITTLIQACVAYTCLVAFKYPDLIGIPRSIKIQLTFLILMAIFRMFAWSERLALIELIAPLMLAFTVRTEPQKFKNLFQIAPLAGFSGLFLLFGATEYFRSWTNTYQDKYNSLAEFVLLRVSEYYYFAINNGLGILKTESSNFPHYSMSWLIKFPVIGDLISNEFRITSYRGTYLESQDLLELNNFGGLLGLVADFGVLAGGILTLALGFGFGRAAKGFASRNSMLGLMFPIAFLAILDLPRIYYLGESRTFIPLSILVISWILLNKKISHDTTVPTSI